MNHIYKLVWNRARNMYMAVSETAKSHGKSGSISRAGRKTAAILLAVLALTAGAGTVSLAADNTAGSGDGVAFGTGSSAPKAENVAIGKGAVISYSNGASTATGDIVVGSGAKIDNYASQGGSIAIGKNAIVNNMTGKQESLFALGQTQYHSGNFWGTLQIPNNPENVAGSIALGDNTYARTGSIMIGSHNYRGLIGDQNVDTSKTKDYEIKTKDYGININATTLGTNSFNQGAFSSVTGAYSIISGKYNGSGFSSYGVQNFGATITGSLNSIESATSSSEYSGIANSIVGTANRAFNSNGSLIFGAGNEIKNSITNISAPSSGGDSAQALQNTLMKAVQDSESGGATLAIGGGNKIDHAVRSQAIGVNNTLTGNLYHEDGLSFLGIPDVNEYSAQYNMVDGYNNNVANVNHAYVIGANNNIQGKTFSDATKDGVLSETDREKAQKDDNLIVIGDNHTLANDVSNNIILGTADKTLTTSVSNVVMIGHNADAQKEGGVALGADSVAAIDKDAVGYDPANGDHQADTTGTWKSTAAAVSVGDASKNITRQITNLAAGAQDTDAVNVAQLKAAQTHFYSVNSTDEKAGNYNNDGAKGTNSLAAGVGALANGSNSVAIGTNAKAQNDALAVGESASAGNNSIAIGMNASAGYSQNMALGYYANVANGVTNSTALGYGSQVTKRDILKSDGKDGVISVGKSVGQSGEAGMTRRIINVKAGVKATDAANVSQLTELKEGEHISITDSATPNEKGQTVKTISVKVDGQIEKGNTGILSGDTVYKEVHVDKDGNYIKSGYTVAENLNALDGKVKTNADNIEKNGQAIEKNSARIDTNSKNIEKNGKNIEILQETKADTNLSNITDAGKTVINNLAKKAVKVKAGSKNVNVTPSDVENGPITYTVDIAQDLNVNSITSKTITSDSITATTVTSDTVKTKNLSVSDVASIGDVTINKDGQGTVNGLKNKTWDPTKITSGQAATEDQLQAATKNAINYDGDNIKTVTLREDTTIKNVADTAIEQGSKNAVNAGTVYNETRVAKDGAFVKQSNTAGENLTALDNQVTANTESIYHMNGRISDLDNRVNKVGAGAAALAALHPLDYDPQDKWDFAAGVGNYRNATAAAVGLFYRPNERTMFNLGWTMGDNRNMVNGGFSLKFGKSNKYIKYSKAEMAAVIDNQSREIAELKAKDAQDAKDNAEMKAEIEALKKQVEALAARK